MELKELINLVVSNGIGVACIVYFMIRDYKFMGTMQETLTTLKESLEVIEQFLIKEGMEFGKTKGR